MNGKAYPMRKCRDAALEPVQVASAGISQWLMVGAGITVENPLVPVILGLNTAYTPLKR